METKKGDFKASRIASNKLKLDPSSAAFAEEILDKKLLLKLKKMKYVEDKNFFKLVNLLEKNGVIFEANSVKRTDYVEKREINHLTLYSFDAPFRLFQADFGNLGFLGKNATFPQYVLVLVDLFSSKKDTNKSCWSLQMDSWQTIFWKKSEITRTIIFRDIPYYVNNRLISHTHKLKNLLHNWNLKDYENASAKAYLALTSTSNTGEKNVTSKN